MKRVKWLLLITAAGAAASALVAGGGSAAKPVTTLQTFSSAGKYTWTVPKGITRVTFDVFGAQGGARPLQSGGSGGEATASFAVQPGETFEIVVGGRGYDAQLTLGLPAPGGSNGGGSGSIQGGGGGGSSDVRVANSGTACATGMDCGYGDRIIVGGGGGGAGGSGNGGAGGGVVGTNGDDLGGGGGGPGTGGSGGTQTEGGLCERTSVVACDGSFGQAGSATSSTYGGGGGGGGWYGGGGGDGIFNIYGGGGGGGSGFYSGFTLSGSFPGGSESGDGLIVVRTP